MKNKFILLYAILLTIALLSSCAFSTEDLMFLDDQTKINYVDQYNKVDAIVADNGNCYIRGKNSSSYLYGVKNTEQYENLYASLDFSKANRFVEIYSGGDAVTVSLAPNGGAIITNKNQLFLFADMDGYEIPKLFCNNAQQATLVSDRIYILQPDGNFGYRNISTPDTFVTLIKDIKDFSVVTSSNQLWLLTTNNELRVYDNESCTSELLCMQNVIDFDIESYIAADSRILYALTYVTMDFECFLYRGFEISDVAESRAYKLTSNATKAAVYSEGVIVRDQNKTVSVYGGDIVGKNRFDGAVIGEDVVWISACASRIALVTEQGKLVCYGALPDSTNNTFSDTVNKNTKTGDGSAS